MYSMYLFVHLIVFCLFVCVCVCVSYSVESNVSCCQDEAQPQAGRGPHYPSGTHLQGQSLCVVYSRDQLVARNSHY